MLFRSLAAVLWITGGAGCSDSPEQIGQATTYKQGKYQGKTDTKPWDNEQFKGDQAAWEKAMKQRASNQNEYRKTP